MRPALMMQPAYGQRYRPGWPGVLRGVL